MFYYKIFLSISQLYLGTQKFHAYLCKNEIYEAPRSIISETFVTFYAEIQTIFSQPYETVNFLPKVVTGGETNALSHAV
jgi:hypothetical protein